MSIPAAFGLSGRVAVVTGAGSPGGIGFATARMLAELGSAVMISGTTARIQDRASELCSAGFDVAGFAADLTDAAAAPKLVSAALERWGRIIMVASVTGPVMAIRADVGYASAKAGMVGLTRAIAVDAARNGITVNAVAPGWIATGSQTPEERSQGQATP